MKRLLVALFVVIGCYVPQYAAAQNVQIVSNNDFHKYQGKVQRFQLDFCFDNYQHHTYWYDAQGELLQYAKVLCKGSSFDTIDTLIIHNGASIQNRHYTYNGGVISSKKIVTKRESFSMPIYQIPSYYYVVPSSTDEQGNWRRATYSYGDNSRYVGRSFVYSGAANSSLSAELERRASLVAEINKPAPKPTATATSKPTTSSKPQQATSTKQSESATTAPSAKQTAAAKPSPEPQPQQQPQAIEEEEVMQPLMRMRELNHDAFNALLDAWWMLAWIILVICGITIWNWPHVSLWFNSNAKRQVVPDGFFNRKFFIALLGALVAYITLRIVVGIGANILNSFNYSSIIVQYGAYLVVVAVSFIPTCCLLLLRRLYKASRIGAKAAKWEFRYVLLLSFVVFSTALLVLALLLIAAIFIGGGSSSRGDSSEEEEMSVDERCAKGACQGCQYYVNGHWCSRYGDEADRASAERSEQ
ncbi:MAG: hypothetical protein IJN55_03850 [Alistipes sp.]|nr:hypothetical protein [Alistipes sp.]